MTAVFQPHYVQFAFLPRTALPVCYSYAMGRWQAFFSLLFCFETFGLLLTRPPLLTRFYVLSYPPSSKENTENCQVLPEISRRKRPKKKMGNILGTPQTFYISYDWHDSSDSSYIDSDYVSSTSEESCAPYSWQQFVSDLLCCPWCGGTLDYKAEEEEDFGWDGAIVGVVRRRGCVGSNLYFFFLLPFTSFRVVFFFFFLKCFRDLIISSKEDSRPLGPRLPARVRRLPAPAADRRVQDSHPESVQEDLPSTARVRDRRGELERRRRRFFGSDGDYFCRLIGGGGLDQIFRLKTSWLK